MTAITDSDSRKRSREDDGSDCMPLSKRITNLHINASSMVSDDNDITDYNMNLNQQQQQSDHNRSSLQHFYNQHAMSYNQSNSEPNQFSEFSRPVHPNNEQARHLQYHQYLNESNNPSSNGNSSASNGSDNINSVEPYDPELSQEENPFYYNKNKLLYDLYVERMRRHQ